MERFKSAIIIGGSRGIGYSVARKFLQEGFALTISSRTADELNKAIDQLHQEITGQVTGYVADIADYDSAVTLFDQHLNNYGSLDAVVNAAAVQGPIGPLRENDPRQWAETVNINLIGCFNICKTALTNMVEKNNGSIIVFSGGGAAYARPYFSSYGASKTGVLRLVETLSCELAGTDVNVYAIAPGAVKTKMTVEVLENRQQAGENAFKEAKEVEEGKAKSPDKAAELCIFLATKRPKNLCGRLIHVNEPYVEYSATNNKIIKEGGLLRRMPYKPQ